MSLRGALKVATTHPKLAQAVCAQMQSRRVVTTLLRCCGGGYNGGNTLLVNQLVNLTTVSVTPLLVRHRNYTTADNIDWI